MALIDYSKIGKDFTDWYQSGKPITIGNTVYTPTDLPTNQTGAVHFSNPKGILPQFKDGTFNIPHNVALDNEALGRWIYGNKKAMDIFRGLGTGTWIKSYDDPNNIGGTISNPNYTPYQPPAQPTGGDQPPAQPTGGGYNPTNLFTPPSGAMFTFSSDKGGDSYTFSNGRFYYPDGRSSGLYLQDGKLKNIAGNTVGYVLADGTFVDQDGKPMGSWQAPSVEKPDIDPTGGTDGEGGDTPDPGPTNGTGEGGGSTQPPDIPTGGYTPPQTFDEFKKTHGYTPPIDLSGMGATLASVVTDVMNYLPTYSKAMDTAGKYVDLANQGVTELNNNKFDPTAYREAERGKISRNARDIAQQSLSAIANRGQVNSSIGADFVAGNTNKYIADAFTDLEASILEAEQKDQVNRTNMYGTLGNMYNNAATIYGNIDKNKGNDRINAVNLYSNAMQRLQNISTAQNADQRNWAILYDDFLTGDLNRNIDWGKFQADYTSPEVSLPPGTTATFNGANFALGGDNQFYTPDGHATGFYAYGGILMDKDHNIVGYFTRDGRLVSNDGSATGTWG